MGLRARLQAIVEGMPEGSSVSLPVNWLRRMIDEEGEGEADPTRLLTLEDVAERVGRSVSTVRTWCNTGELGGAFKLQGRDWRIRESDLCRWIEDQIGTECEATGAVMESDADLGSWREHYRDGEAA